MNSGITSIQHLGADAKEEFRHPAHRLVSTFNSVRDSYRERSVLRDMWAEQDAINAWPTITACYSGIEQAMKLLRLAQGEEMASLKKRGHHISVLFNLLEDEEQRVLHFSYRVYQSLHTYIERETVADFLNEIDRGGGGYGDWRYFLLQGSAPPRTHPGAMLEIWSALCDIIRARILSNSSRGLYSCDRRLLESIGQCILDAWMDGIEETGATSEETDALNRWGEANAGPINRYADFAHSYYCGTPSISNAAVDGSVVQPILLKSLSLLEKKAQKDQDLAQFLYRTKQADIVWSETAQQFEKPNSAP